MEEETHQKIRKIQLFVAISLLLISTLVLFRDPTISGHFSADFRSQPVDLAIDHSQSYLLKTDSPEPIYITSLRLSGNVIGDGSVEIIIEDQDKEILVYKNVKDKEDGLSSITAMAVAPTEGVAENALLLEPVGIMDWAELAPISEDEEYSAGPFNNRCADTCFIEMPLSSELTYKLVFMVEPGTKLEITKITYILKSESV